MATDIRKMMTMKTTTSIKSYKELIKLKTFEERLRYLQLNANVGIETFGSGRWLNQRLYHSSLWADVKNEIIIRDNGCDLGLEGYEIRGRIYLHHLNPITKEDVLNNSSKLCDPNNLICVSFDTHQSIHYGSECAALSQLVERRPNDTCPWKR